MSEQLRSKILAALGARDHTLTQLHAAVDVDSRLILNSLHTLAGMKLVTCERTSEGLMWSLIGETDVAPLERAPVAEVRRIEPPEPEVPAFGGGTQRERVVEYLKQAGCAKSANEVFEAIGLGSMTLCYTLLSQLTKAGKLVRSGVKPNTRYALATSEITVSTPTKATESLIPVDKIPVNSESVAEPVRQPTQDDQLNPAEHYAMPPRSESWISLRVAVPMHKATAVLRAIEQALA